MAAATGAAVIAATAAASAGVSGSGMEQSEVWGV